MISWGFNSEVTLFNKEMNYRLLDVKHFIKIPWRNGSASDSRSEGCVFESRRGHWNILDHMNCMNGFFLMTK